MPRLIAEWEKQEYAVVVFPHKHSDWIEYLDEIRDSYINFIKTISRFQMCIVLCENEEDMRFFKLTKNVKAFIIKTNDTWIRDFGGVDVEENGEILTYDFIFNAWGGKFKSELDNKANEKLCTILNKKIIKKEFVLEGGSIDTNGKGALLTTSSCIFNKNRNPSFTPKKIKDILCNLFGIDEFICFENGFILGDDTDSHVDILARFIDEKTIAYHVCDDKSDEHFSSLKLLEHELKNSKFDLLALPFPDKVTFKGQRLGASYLNFVFVNGGLIVPTYNQPKDKEVLKILQNFLNIDVVGVDASVFIRQNGSLHCASKNYFIK